MAGFEVIGDTLAIAGQSVLGGAKIRNLDILKMESAIVAIATSEGCFLKRVGKPLPQAKHVIQFESVGGLGVSLLVRIEDVENDNLGNLPLLHSAREVLGVLY